MSFVICYRNKILLSSALETHEIVRFIWFAIALTNAVNRVGNEDILVFLLRFPGSREGNGLNVSVFWRRYYAQFSSASRILYPRERNVWALCIRWKFLLGIRVTSKEHFGYFWGTSGLIGFNDCDIIRQRHWILIGRKMICIFHISFFFFVFYCFFSLSLFRYELDYDLNERIIN